MIEHTSPISGIAGYSDKYISTAGYDNQVILWDAKSKRALGRGQHDHLANQCRFSHDGQYLVSSGSDHTARVWEVPSMKLMAVLADHDDDVESIAINEQDHTIATCSRDHQIRIFSRSGELIKTLVGHTQDVISVEWLEGSSQLISSSDDGTVKRWCAQQGKLLEDIDMGGVETDTVVISSKGVIFAANDDGNIISINSVSENRQDNGSNHLPESRLEFNAHKAGIKRLVYSRSSNAIVSLSYDRSVKIWSIERDVELVLVKSTQIPSIVWPRSCCFIGESLLAFATFGSCYATLDCNTLEWDLSSINPTQGINAVLDTEAATLTVGDAGIVHYHPFATRSSDDERLQTLPSLCNFLVDFFGQTITGGQSGEIFDAVSGEVLHQHHSPLNCGTAFMRGDDYFVAIGAYTGEIILLKKSANKRTTYERTLLIQDNAIKGICNDGKRLFSVSATGQAAFHNLSTLEPIKKIPHGHFKISNGCTALGDNLFASVSRDLKLRIWSEGQCELYAAPHTFSIKCIAAIPERGMIAIGSYGGQVALFDANSREWIRDLRPTTAGISNICPRYDGKGFIASSYDGKLHNITV